MEAFAAGLFIAGMLGLAIGARKLLIALLVPADASKSGGLIDRSAPDSPVRSVP